MVKETETAAATTTAGTAVKKVKRTIRKCSLSGRGR
jgi:hypothetical protein